MRHIKFGGSLEPGRVFELRSQSAKYAAPCALIVKEEDDPHYQRFAVRVDRFGAVGEGFYRRRGNPAFQIEYMSPTELEKRIRCRRPDLERFDAEDVALVAGGYGLDFGGKITLDGYSSKMFLPGPGDWTIFWTYHTGTLPMLWGEQQQELDDASHGAWHCMRHGGPRYLGFGFGRAWLTRQRGARLRGIERVLSRLPHLERQEISMVRTADGARVVGPPCPVLYRAP